MKTLPRGFNRLITLFQKYEIPGKYRFFQKTKVRYRDYVIQHKIKGATFMVPWDQWCFWVNYGPENYYLEEIKPFTDVINTQLNDFDFFDLGADVGVVSALVNKYCDNLHQIYAFEPNPRSFPILMANVGAIGKQHKAYNKAISDFSGLCHLRFASEQGSDHEGYIQKNKQGNTNVISIDSFSTHITLKDEIVLKIDVEGQELSTLKGAQKTIASANKVVILLELHPEVLTRDNQSPEVIFEAAESIRNFRWLVPLLDNKEVDRSTAFFEQFPNQQYDIIGIAT